MSEGLLEGYHPKEPLYQQIHSSWHPSSDGQLPPLCTRCMIRIRTQPMVLRSTQNPGFEVYDVPSGLVERALPIFQLNRSDTMFPLLYHLG